MNRQGSDTDASSRPLSAQGVLRVSVNGSVRYVYVDVDLSRIPGLTLRGIPRNVLLTEPSTVPGYVPEPLGRPAGVSVSPGTALGESDDRLTAALKGQPLEKLGLGEQTCMELWGLGILTVRQLLDWSEFDLRWKISKPALSEVLERVNFYGLRLSSVRRSGIQRRSFEENQQLLAARPRVSEEEAQQILGDEDFEAFARYVRGEERVSVRNALAVKHHKLSWWMAAGLVTKAAFCWNQGNYQRYQYSKQLDAMDLYQEGIIGLFRAVELFDHLGGNRFSTFAGPHILAKMQRAIIGSLEIPPDVYDDIRRWRNARRRLTQDLGRIPEDFELAAELRLTLERVRLIAFAAFQLRRRSLTEPLTHDDGGEGELTLEGTIPSPSGEDPVLTVDQENLRQTVDRVLRSSGLVEAERRALDLYYGLSDRVPRTLAQVGEIMGVTRERIRQRLEAALKKLQTEEVWRELAPYLAGNEEDAPVILGPGHRWEQVYATWNSIREEWDPSWTPGIALYQVCRWYGVALSDILDGPPEEKLQPLACLLMAICCDIFGQSAEAVADRFRVSVGVVLQGRHRYHTNFRRLSPLFDGLTIPEGRVGDNPEGGTDED